MNFLGGAGGSKRLISQNPLLKIVSKKYGLMLRTVENKIEITILSFFVGKKLEFSKIFNIFVVLAYELHNKILILEKFDDFFFQLFKTFFQILSRTWGINFDTIACVFELVDGQKKCLIFSTIFPENYFFEIFFLGLSIHFPPLEVVEKIFRKFSFFSSYPTLFYPPPKNYFFNCVPSISFFKCV